jgi:protein-L-isoaspartate(D-aspartate) O-methyltransferase
VAATCELLALLGTEHVLEVGTGSGYAAAVLAELASSVVSIERIPELAELARHALAEAGYDRVSVIVGDGSRGLPEQAPFDAIAVAAAAPHVPERLVAQLRVGGRLVLPLGSRRAQMLTVVERTPAGSSLRAVVPCRFVPLVGDEGFRPADVG